MDATVRELIGENIGQTFEADGVSCRLVAVRARWAVLERPDGSLVFVDGSTFVESFLAERAA